MTDDKRVQELQENLMRDVNGSSLPLSVKALALENILLRVQIAMQPPLQEQEAPDA